MATMSFATRGGVIVERQERETDYEGALDRWLERLDTERGAAFTSGYEYPGRYTRWDFALAGPPLAVEGRGRTITVSALNARGQPLIAAAADAFSAADLTPHRSPGSVSVTVPEPDDTALTEEDRSRRPSAFTALRALTDFFASDADGQLGLAGAFGYDLAFQFDPIVERLPRPANQREIVLYLPDEILAVDHYAKRAIVASYEFTYAGAGTHGLSAEAPKTPTPKARNLVENDHEPGEYADTVRRAFPHFARGDLFEVVPGQVFREALPDLPSTIMRRLSAINPSPYGFFINLGAAEYLVGASP
ncbi:MAG: anthranilate synthase component I, partial [Pseudomonadota bacterium]